MSDCCDISSLWHQQCPYIIQMAAYGTNGTNTKWLFTLECVLYLIKWRWITVLCRGTFSRLTHSFFVDFRGLVLGLLKMCFNIYHCFSTFWCLIYDWSLQCSCRKSRLDSILDGTQHIQGLDFSLYYLFICDFYWKISNSVCRFQDFDIYNLSLYFPFAYVSFYEVTNELSIKALWLKHFSTKNGF